MQGTLRTTPMCLILFTAWSSVQDFGRPYELLHFVLSLQLSLLSPQFCFNHTSLLLQLRYQVNDHDEPHRFIKPVEHLSLEHFLPSEKYRISTIMVQVEAQDTNFKPPIEIKIEIKIEWKSPCYKGYSYFPCTESPEPPKTSHFYPPLISRFLLGLLPTLKVPRCTVNLWKQSFL